MFRKINRIFWIFLGISLMCPMKVFDQTGRVFTSEDLLRLKRLSGPQISPLGDWIAVQVSQYENDRSLNLDIWLISKDGTESRKVIDNRGPDTAPRWSPDGKTLAFLYRGVEEKLPQIVFYSLSDGKFEQKTQTRRHIRDFKWSPDGKSLGLTMEDTLSEAAALKQKQGDDAVVVDKDLKYTRLWILDKDSGNARMLSQKEETVTDFNFSPDGRSIAVLASPYPTAEGYEYNSHLGLIDVATGAEAVLTDKINALTAPSFSPDGQWIAYIGPIGSFKERGILKVISIKGGDPIELLRDFRGNVWDVQWHPVWNTILATMATGLHHQLISIDLKGRSQFLFSMEHSFIPYWQDCWSVSNDGTSVAYLNEQLNHPAEVWVSSISGTARKQVTQFNRGLEDINLGKVEEMTWTNPEDGAQVDGILIKPANFDSSRIYPLITWFHGGPAYNWSVGAHVFTPAQLFVSQGYVVFLPNFRGSSGQGMEWMMKNVRDWGRGPMGDVMSGVSFLIRKGWVDKSRLYIGGASYGGYLTAWIITQTDRFRAAYVQAGVIDLFTEYQLTDEPSFLLGYFQKSPYEDELIYRKNSPLTYTSQVRTPVLIIHGEKDIRVPVSQSKQFYSALKHFGTEVELVIYPREGHSIREYVHQVDLYRRMISWFQTH